VTTTVTLPGPTPGRCVAALGLGLYGYGQPGADRRREVAALREAIEIGYRVFDTAEMYGDGGSEEVLGRALAEAFAAGAVRREEVFVVSKVYPHNASRAGVKAACDRSRRRLGLDRIDLYLLHWRGSVPLAQTVAGFMELANAGAIARFGVSNFDVDDMDELWAVEGGAACAANQVWYSLSERGIEFDLLPWQRAHGVPLMAYSPLDKGQLAEGAALRVLAQGLGVTVAQVALARLLAQPGVMVIPKAGRSEHLRENWAAQQVVLAPRDLAAIDAACPPPTRKRPLATS
jgi:diketogulonate reductase-like aldo/keto reductase